MAADPLLNLFPGTVDLGSAALGGSAVACSDDFFASKDNLVRPAAPAFDPSTYTDRGKEMDGWESRRRRVPGHDWCVVRLGVPGRIVGVDVDTAYFLGNHAPFASLEGAVFTGDDVESAVWAPLIPSTPLIRGTHNVLAVQDERVWTHVRLHMIPDGGVARLRIYGTPRPPRRPEMDLVSASVGGHTVACSDAFFSPMGNLLLPGASAFMGGGWETRRSRPPGRDWIIVALGLPGKLSQIVLDTGHFKGNYPDRAVVDGLCWPHAPAHALVDHVDWVAITGWTQLKADAQHVLPVLEAGPWTHLRLRIQPDGGVARLRALGIPLEPEPGDDPLLRWVNDLPPAELLAGLKRCCASTRWGQSVAAKRPFVSRTQLFGEAEAAWWNLFASDWHEALAEHPRIGADVAVLKKRFASTATWSHTEQAAASVADDKTLAKLAAGNAAYEAKYGWCFVIDATGRTAAEIVEAQTERMLRDPASELAVAAGEVAKITRRRLEKWATA